MRETATFAAVTLVLIAAMGMAAQVHVPQNGGGNDSAFSLQFVRTGGIAGANDVLIVDSSGLATYSSRFGPAFNASLSSSEIHELEQVLNTNLGAIQPGVFHSKSGAADFFWYSLDVTVGGKTTHISWMDEWATSEPFPDGLRAIQQALQGIIQQHI